MSSLTQTLRLNWQWAVSRRGIAIGGLLLVSLLIGLVGSVPRQSMPRLAAASPETVAAIKAKVQKLPLYFIENHGQTDAQVAYYVQGRRTSAYFTSDGLTLSLQEPPPPVAKTANPAGRAQRPMGREARPQEPARKRWAVQVRFVGAAPVLPHGGAKTAATVNYFKGPQAEWKTALPTYSDIVYPQVWPGVDVVYGGDGGRIKTTFQVQPGADPRQIQLAYQGASALSLTDAGRLAVQTPVGGFEEDIPVVYQDIDGRRVSVEARYTLAQTGAEEWHYGFELGGYDRNRPLVIDPVLVYSTYLGGSGEDVSYSIAVDSASNTYMTGYTTSVDFPAVNAKYPQYQGGSYDAFVTKLSANGQTVIYSTYLGGGNWDMGNSIAVDSVGNATVTGYTDSADFPTFNAKYPQYQGGRFDAFVTKLSANGQAVVYSTYLGGSGYDYGSGIAVDGAGNAYVAGSTYSADFPAVNAKYPQLRYWDAFVTKLSTNGQAVAYSTYLGGSDNDYGSGIAVDGAGNAYVTGETWSADFPAVNAKYPQLRYWDAFITKLSPNGQAVAYSTYLGGSGRDDVMGIAVDGAGNAYVTGYTRSADFPAVNAKYPHLWGDGDAFVFKLSANGQAVAYSTYLGGSDTDWGQGIAVDGAGNAYVMGYTYSADFPAVNAKYPQLRGGSDAFVTKLSTNGQAVAYSTYLGGSDWEGDWGCGIAVDGAGNAYVTGYTVSVDFPTSATDPTIVSYDPTYNGGSDAFVAKFGNALPASAALGLPSPVNNSGFAAEPVNTATGNYYYQHADLKLPGKGLPFGFTRTYNAQDSYSGPLGYGWTHSYNARLIANLDGSVVVKQGDGHEEFYDDNGNGTYNPRYPGVYSALVKNADGGFYLTDKSQTRQEFDGTGRLMAVRDANGNALSFNYDAGGDLTAIADTAGRGYALVYDASHRLTQLTDPIGRAVQYAYDANGNLTGVTDARGGVMGFEYDASHHVTRIVEPRGNVLVANVYDAAGRVTQQTNGRGFATTFAYDAPNAGDTTITDALGQATIHTHDGQRRLIAETDPLGGKRQYVYDTSNNRIQITDPKGQVTAYAYDARGNVTSKTDALGGVTTLEYDAQNHPIRRVDALGLATAFAYDANGNLTQTTDALGNISKIAYDAQGLPIKLTDTRGFDTLNTFDVQGNLTQTQDALGNKTAYAYDGAGRRTSVTDTNGQKTQFAYDANDNLVQTTDPLGAVTAYVYDANDNRISVTDALGRVTSNAYDANDLLVSVTDPLGNVTMQAYDALDRRSASTDPRGNTTGFAYDAAGRLVRVTDARGKATAFSYDANGNRLTQTNPLGHVTTFAYDTLNRQISTTDALGKVTATAYDALGRVTQTTDANGKATSYTYDALGRLTKVTDPAGGVTAAVYDAAGTRTRLTDPKGNTVNFAYDALNRLTSRTDALGLVTSYAYDAVGNRISLTDAKNQTLQYAYDANRRLLETRYPDNSKVSLVYDAVGNRISMTDTLGQSVFQYDALNRLTQYSNPFNKTVGSEYDAVGNRTALVYPDGKRVVYTYDALNRMKTVTDWLGGMASYVYDDAGNLSATNQPNGATANYAYDNAERLARLTDVKANLAVIADYKLTLDAVGNRLQVERTEPATASSLPPSAAYLHDADNRLSSINGSPVTHDNNGNLLTAPGQGLSYDYEDRLVDALGGALHNRYDGLGNRLQASSTRYALDIAGAMANVLVEYDTTGNVLAYYVHGLGLLAQIGPTGTARYYHYDTTGSTVALSDQNGNLTDTYAYDPFGLVMGGQAATRNPFHYVGQFGVMDEGGGLLFMRHRYMDAATGRFVSQDPLPGGMANGQSLNRYVYALNNPGRFVDYLGLSARDGIISGMSIDSTDSFHQPLLGLKDTGGKVLGISTQKSIIADQTTSTVRDMALAGTSWALKGAESAAVGLMITTYDTLDKVADALTEWKPVIVDVAESKKTGNPPKTWGGNTIRGAQCNWDLECMGY